MVEARLGVSLKINLAFSPGIQKQIFQVVLPEIKRVVFAEFPTEIQ